MTSAYRIVDYRLSGTPKNKSNKLGIIQLMAGGGIFIVGLTLVPLLSGLFSTT